MRTRNHRKHECRYSRSRRGFSILEVVLALALLVMMLIPIAGAVSASARTAARAEDLAYFQALASTVLDAAAREDFGKVEQASRENEPRATWTDWQKTVLGAVKDGVHVRSFVQVVDPHAVLFTVEVRWDDCAARGRATDYSAKVSRVLVRPEASLAMVTTF